MVEKTVFGKTSDNKQVFLYTIENSNGIKVKITDFGGIIVNLIVPDKNGSKKDVVLGYDNLEQYFDNPCFFGAIIGPNANRIAGAKFELDGVEYKLDVNDNANNLHSHKDLGYHKRVWDTQILDNGIKLSLTDNATMGFPGNKNVSVTYTLDDDNALKIEYNVSSDVKTIINLTNHTYFNLEGFDYPTIKDHELWLGAAYYTKGTKELIPTGEIAGVKGTPLDFTVMKRVGDEIAADFEDIKFAGGYDHNWVVDNYNGELRHIATLKAPKSGIEMETYTTLPGVQIYSGNFVDDENGKNGVKYGNQSAICLETQYYPDNIHHANFPQAIFGGKGNDYNSTTVYKFV